MALPFKARSTTVATRIGELGSKVLSLCNSADELCATVVVCDD